MHFIIELAHVIDCDLCDQKQVHSLHNFEASYLKSSKDK